MLADPRLTGMNSSELDALRTKLAPAQEAAAEQHRYMLRKGRRVATTGRSRSLLSGADEVLLTIVFALDGLDTAWLVVLDAVHWLFPTLPVVGYEHGDGLAAAVRHGFEPIGPLRIWTHRGQD